MLRSGPVLGNPLPSVIDVMASSINIMQVQITRSRFAAEPADVFISPQLAQMALMDFHRATEAIDEGRRATGSDACANSGAADGPPQVRCRRHDAGSIGQSTL